MFRRNNFLKFNLICLILSGIFLIGMGWIYVRNAKAAEMRNIEMKVEEIKKLSNSFRSERDPAMAGETKNNSTTELVVIENDSSTSSSLRSDFVQNDSVALPKEINLSVPFTSQAPEKNWEQPWQDACEEAALLMLDAYYKHYNLSPLFAKDEILKIIKWEEERGWGNSIEMEKVKEMMSEYFHLSILALEHFSTTTQRTIKIIENPTVEQIKKSIAAGNPVLVVADGKVLPNPHFRNGGPVYHALIIKGYTETEFITNDPGTQFGKNFKYKYQDLLNAIHDWNNGDVKNGRRVVLVVE